MMLVLMEFVTLDDLFVRRTAEWLELADGLPVAEYGGVTAYL